MAPKRPVHLDEPPSLSSEKFEEGQQNEAEPEIDEEEGESEESEEEEGESGEENEEVKEEESESEEEEEEIAPNPLADQKTFVQKPNNTTIPKPQSSSEHQSSEGSDSDSPNASDFTIKPIVSKPMNNSPKPKKSTATRSNSGSKRPAEKKEENVMDLQKKKKSKVSNADEEDKAAVEEKKGHGIIKLWSEDDEIAILKGMINYKLKKGADPYTNMGAFYEFIKESIHVDVSKNQLIDKIRRLKKKYQNNAEKGENGEDPVFSKPHEHKSFELSKKIWGGGSSSSNGMDSNIKSTNNKSSKGGKVNSIVASMKEKENTVVVKEKSTGEVKANQEDFWSMYPYLFESLQIESHSLPKDVWNVLKENASLIGHSKAKELEEKWKNLRVKEVQLYLEQLEFIHDQAKLVLDALKSSKS